MTTAAPPTSTISAIGRPRSPRDPICTATSQASAAQRYTATPVRTERARRASPRGVRIAGPPSRQCGRSVAIGRAGTAALSAVPVQLQRVCVYCGSSRGADPAYADAADALGSELVRRGIGLVYGGGSVGLMGVIADAVLAGGGDVIGVIPRFLHRREIMHAGVTDLRVVESMHERKALMAELSDGFVVLPGGIGTFEEMFEAMTWTQLGIHTKPVGLLDVDGLLGAGAGAARPVRRRRVPPRRRGHRAARDRPRSAPRRARRLVTTPARQVDRPRSGRTRHRSHLAVLGLARCGRQAVLRGSAADAEAAGARRGGG